MTETEIIARLEKAELALDRGEGLGGTGFWKVVTELKKDPTLVETFAQRVADIDRRGLEQWALITVPVGGGTAIALVVTALGLAGVGAAYYLPEPWNWLIFGAATADLLVSTHGLGHLVVGKAVGMRFTHWFVGKASQPQPGVKVDYTTYLRTPARQRAWMHAAGAIVTKLVPFVLIPAAVAADLPNWVSWLLALVGVAATATDAIWSTQKSDWAKFRREMSYAE